MRRWEGIKYEGYMSHRSQSIGEIHVLNKVLELAKRCGLDPVSADIRLSLNFPNDDDYNYSLGGMEGQAGTPEEQANIQKMWTLLGLDASGNRRFNNLGDVNEAVDGALSLAPRARFR